MSLTNIETSSSLQPETVRAIENRQPLPMDQKIRGGVPVLNALDDNLRQAVDHRLDSVFDGLRTDNTTEFGACIAFIIDACRDIDDYVSDIDDLDWVLRTGAKRQNHGMVAPLQFEDDGAVLWSGKDEFKYFQILKHIGPVAMDDQTVRDGVVYSLTGSRLP